MNLADRLGGKVAIITGGASGLGALTCKRLVAEGARVVVADIRADAAQALADEIGPGAAAFEFDYFDESSIQALIDDTISRHGRIDLLHNNAIGGAGIDGGVIDADPAVWDRAYGLNVRGYMLASKYALPHMVARRTGVIVNMSSASALTGGLRLTAYGAVKAAVVAMSQYIATQHGKDGIRCVSLSAGATKNIGESRLGSKGLEIMERHTLMPALGDPNDVAALVAFLASDESASLTGVDIRIDGGLLSHLPTFADTRGPA